MANKTSKYALIVKRINEAENEILNSDEYIKLKELQEELEQKIKVIQLPIIELQEELNDIKKQILDEHVIDESIARFKYKKKSEVNTKQLMETVPKSDLESLITVTQKSLKDYSKKIGDKSLLELIQVKEEVPVDIIIND